VRDATHEALDASYIRFAAPEPAAGGLSLNADKDMLGHIAQRPVGSAQGYLHPSKMRYIQSSEMAGGNRVTASGLKMYWLYLSYLFEKIIR
jgi:hypothetical protein